MAPAPTTVIPVPHSATPYSIMYTLTGVVDDTPGLRSINNFMVDLADGPLKRTLKAASPAALAAFNVDGARGSEIRIYDVAACPADATVPRTEVYTVAWVSDASTALAGLSCTLQSGEIRTIEIRLNHSTQA